MRQIGGFSSESEARILEDYLLTQGIEATVRPDGSGWTLWVIRDEHLDQASRIVAEYRADPTDLRYRGADKAAREIRRGHEKEEHAYRRRVVDVGSRWGSITMRARPVTTFLVGTCVVVFFLTELRLAPFRLTELLYLPTIELGLDGRPEWGLRGLQTGQVWRLFTPILLHFGPLHIFLNMLMFWRLGGSVESLWGSRFLIMFVGLCAVLSNAGQAFWDLQSPHGLHPFGGMSGVNFALFGFAVIRSNLNPATGLAISSQSVTYMLLFLIACFTGYLGPVANAAHTIGLLVGVVYGFASS